MKDFSEYRLRSLVGGGMEFVHVPTDLILIVTSDVSLQTLINVATTDQEGL